MQRILNRSKSMNSCYLVGTITCGAPGLGDDARHLRTGQPGSRQLARKRQGELQPSLSETVVDRPTATTGYDLGWRSPCCRPRWTASADFIILDRVGGVDQTLVETVAGSVSLRHLHDTPGTEVLNADDLQPGFAAGPKLGLIRHGATATTSSCRTSRSTSGTTIAASAPLPMSGWSCVRQALPSTFSKPRTTKGRK